MILLLSLCSGCSALVATERGAQRKGVESEGTPPRELCRTQRPVLTCLSRVHSDNGAAARHGLPARGIERL